MNCDCRERFEEQARQKFVAKFGEDAVDGDVSARMDGVFLFGDSGVRHLPALPVVVSGLIFNKRRTGATAKKITIQAIASFCPFCGEEINPEAPELEVEHG